MKELQAHLLLFVSLLSVGCNSSAFAPQDTEIPEVELLSAASPSLIDWGGAPGWKQLTLDNIEIYAKFVSGDKLAFLKDLVGGVPQSLEIDDEDVLDRYLVVVCQIGEVDRGSRKRILWLDLKIMNDGMERVPEVKLRMRIRENGREYHVKKIARESLSPSASDGWIGAVPIFRATRVAVK